MKILIIDDDKELANYIQLRLEDFDYQVDVENDGVYGELKALENKHDMIILDVMLPGIDGYTMCKNLRKKSIHTPILMLSSMDYPEEEARGYAVGANAYLTKPIDFEKLHDKIKVLNQRFHEATLP